ncbi:unnamed protein product [Scytosiphon promiscuus]
MMSSRCWRQALAALLPLWTVQLLLLLDFPRGWCLLTDVERSFLEVPSPDGARESLKHITSKPHVAGTPGDHEMAEYVHDRFVSFGIPSVEVQPVEVLLSNPIESSLEMIDASSGTVVFTASLSEDVLDLDTTSDVWHRNHTFNGYSPSGDVTAPAVYANYGRPEDFDALEEAGVSVDGAIVITRYGQCFRGLKAMNAQERGAVGALIYSDPQQDGFTRGSTYPDGGWRPSSSVQRGSVEFNSLCAGDPSRTANSRTVEEVCGYSKDELVPLIPVMPISVALTSVVILPCPPPCRQYGDAEPILRALGGTAAPEGFQGGLDFPYTVGPSSATTVRIVVENEEHVGPVWNVIGTVPGTLPQQLDRPVVLGNHRDAWIFGAVDPNSGTASLIELARGLGALLADGWKPLRTIILCSWSGEELGMLGSTAWGEEHAEGILKNAAAYLNVDSAVSGSLLRVKATPSLGGLVSGVLADVEDPASADGGTLLEAWSGDLQMLGSGSDYAVFLDHLGIATVDVEFQQDEAAEYGVYHSIYDSFTWVDTYGDPGFRYFQATSRVWGLMALRLASSEVLPFDPPLQAAALEGYVDSLAPSPPPSAAADGPGTGGGDEHGGSSVRSAAPPAAGAAGAVAAAETSAAGALALSEADLAPLRDAVAAFRVAADAVGSWSDTAPPPSDAAAAHSNGNGNGGSGSGSGGEESGGGVEGRPVSPATAAAARAVALRGAGAGTAASPAPGDQPRGGSRSEGSLYRSAAGLLRIEDLNDRLAMTERRFLVDEGLPGRKWYRHVLQAPGLYLGYAAESFPGITQALSDGDLELAQEQVQVAAARVSEAAAFLSGEDEGSK